jgi:tryptophan halogenase
MKNIDSIVIVGGGSSGWMTAATLIKAFPNKKISVIESKDVPIIGVGESTLGGIRRWTRFIGLDESSFFPDTDASYKLSIKFTDFYKKDAGSFQYPFGTPFSDESRNGFSDWHFKKYYYPETPVEDFVQCLFPAAALFENNKYNPNTSGEFDNFNSNNDVAYHFDAVKFGRWLCEKYCKPNGVTHIEGTVVKINTDDNGIASLDLEDGSNVTADLYVDCTGFKSLLLSETLKEPFTSYSHMLPNNKAWATRLAYKDRSKELEGFTNSTAIENGWCWNIPLWSRLGTGYVYSDKYVTKEQALEEFKNYLMSDKMVIPRTKEEVDQLEFKEITMRVGIHERTFVKNVVAIGLSAGFIEPLESNGLFSVHEFLFRLVDILQRGAVNQFDKDMYNVTIKEVFDGFAKFVAMHYALSLRDDTPYWKANNDRIYTDASGDPYSPHVNRTDAFYNMGWRYMQEWGHPIGNGGITYIATGMHYFMMNNARIQDLEFRTGQDILKATNSISDLWEVRKARWKKAADQSPTLEQYLADTFYNTIEHKEMPIEKSASKSYLKFISR